MIPYVLFTTGLLLRAIHISLLHFKKTDVLYMLAAVGMGLYMALKIVAENQSGYLMHPGFGVVIGFSAVIAFAFRQRICPAVGEGLHVLYGFVGTYIFVVYFLAQPHTEAAVLWGILFVFAYNAISITTAITSGKPSAGLQIIHMILFLMMSLGIGAWLVVQGFEQVDSVLGLVLLGYASLMILSSAYYLLFLIPFPGGLEGFSSRLADVNEHMSFLESKFIHSDLSPFVLMSIVGMVGIVIMLDMYTSVSAPVLVSAILALGSMVLKPHPKKQPSQQKTAV